MGIATKLEMLGTAIVVVLPSGFVLVASVAHAVVVVVVVVIGVSPSLLAVQVLLRSLRRQ
jgi:hypothetical protein